MAVFVLDRRKKPLMPCSEKRARLLLKKGRARIHRMYPFTIRIVDRTQQGSVLQPLNLKIDPGSRTTGIAIVFEHDNHATIVTMAELEHRGHKISETLAQRAAFRRRRRSANLRYRTPRFDNRRKPKGWLPPSLKARVDATLSVINSFRRLAPITSLAQELVRFDTQLMQNPDISGVQYQQGTLAGYEVREYVFEKWGRQCVYCGASNLPLNLDHLHPKSKGGSDRASNLAPSCQPCNVKKNNSLLKEFLKNKPETLENILKNQKTPLRDAAAINATRWTLFEKLKAGGIPLASGTGGRTKYNRHRYNLPKSHSFDALCVGNMDHLATFKHETQPVLLLKATAAAHIGAPD